jgi:hypothetical protein
MLGKNGYLPNFWQIEITVCLNKKNVRLSILEPDNSLII